MKMKMKMILNVTFVGDMLVSDTHVSYTRHVFN